MTEIDPMHWRIILDGIYQGKCVPFLGAGVNTGLPMGGDVALRLLEIMTDQEVETEDILVSVKTLKEKLEAAGLDKDLAQPYYRNLPRVALHVLVKNEFRKVYLVQWLRQILAEDRCEPSPLLRTLAEMPFRLIVTTNYDCLLERALDHAIDNTFRISEADLDDVPGLAARLQSATDDVSEYIRDGLSRETRQLLEAYDSTNPVPDALCTALSEGLNRLLKDGNFYASERFEQVLLTDEIQTLIGNRSPGGSSVRLNRLLLEQAYPTQIAKAKGRKPYKRVVQPIGGFESAQSREQSTDLPEENTLIVYKIHGTLQPEGSSELVITEDDYVQFLTRVGREAKGIPTYIRQSIADGSLLFLGYSLEDWDFRMVYRELIETLPRHTQSLSFAIRENPPAVWVRYWKEKGIVTYGYDVHQFAAELKQRYTDRYGSLSAGRW